MPTPEIEEFARKLVRGVRDAAIRNCDALLRPQAESPIARRWKGLNASPALGIAIPDAIDQAVFSILLAIDQGVLPLKYMTDGGQDVNLAEQGLGELAGWYMMSGGWREMFSSERFADDLADLGG